MKISILSMQRVNNFGSLLQAYSLKKILEENGNNTVSFLDIQRNEDDDRLMEKRIDFAKEQEKRGIIKALPHFDRYFCNRYLNKRANRKQNALFEAFRENTLGITKESSNEQVDCCVIGSDEVFNCAVGNWWGFTTQLFGNVHQADKVLSYAASCGSTHDDMLPNAVKERIAASLEKLEMISVRDNNTMEFVNHILQRQAAVQHCDPVVIADFDQEIKDTEITEALPEHYCVVYAYFNRINKKEEIQAIKEFCWKNKLTIVSVGAPQYWIKHHLVLRPFEMLKVFQKADFVITDTFHGTIFSAKYSKCFAVIARMSNKEKLLDLLERLEITSHLISDMKELSMTERRFENDFSVIRRIEKEERERSMRDLRKAVHE